MVDAVHVCSAHPSDDSRVFHRGCVSLAQHGYITHLIAADPAHAPYTVKGVVIHPLRPPRTRGEHVRRRWEVARRAAALDPALFHVHEPALMGPVLAVARGRPVVFDSHESYPDLIRHEWRWLPRWLRGLTAAGYERMERRYLRRMAGVITVSPQIASRFARYHPNVHVVANYPSLSDWGAPVERRGGSNVCLHAGGITPRAGLLEVVRAIGLLQARGTTLRLRLVGRVADAGHLELIHSTARACGVADQVEYCGVLSQAELRESMSQAFCGIGLYERATHFYLALAISRKQVEYMAAGLPVVAPEFGSFPEVIRAHDAGLLVPPESPEQIAGALEELFRNPERARAMGRSGRAAVEQEFNWSQEERSLIQMYRELIGEGSGGGEVDVPEGSATPGRG